MQFINLKQAKITIKFKNVFVMRLAGPYEKANNTKYPETKGSLFFIFLKEIPICVLILSENLNLPGQKAFFIMETSLVK